MHITGLQGLRGGRDKEQLLTGIKFLFWSDGNALKLMRQW